MTQGAITLTDIETASITGYDEGRDNERADVARYLYSEATSWELVDRPDLAGLLRQLARDVNDQKHHGDDSWMPRSRADIPRQ